MKFKHITQQFHEVYHTNNEIRHQNSPKDTMKTKTLKPIIKNRRL